MNLIDNKINTFEELLKSMENCNKIDQSDEKISNVCKYIYRSIHIGDYYDQIKCKSIEEYKNLVEGAIIDIDKWCRDDILNLYNSYNDDKLKLVKNTVINELIKIDKKIIDNVKKFFNSFSTILKVKDEKNILNSYRQGFILLVANFDATIFDMINILLEEKFFEYISSFNSDRDKKVNLKIDEIVSCQSFDGVKEEIIARTLKGKYIKDILEILNILRIDYINQKYADIIECMNRRNIHLHKGGMVDKKYCEKFNIFTFEIGEIATINEEYFSNAIDLCKNTVESIYSWIYEKI